MKGKIRRKLCLLMAGFVVLAGCGDTGGDNGWLLYCGAAEVGGMTYTVCSGIATVVNEYCDNININAQVTSGSNENYSLMMAGEVEMCLIDSGMAHRVTRTEIDETSSYYGIEDYGTNQELTMLMNTEGVYFLAVVPEDSGIRTFDDILQPGVRIGGPVPGSSSYDYIMGFLELGGASVAELDIYNASRGELCDALKDGNIDVLLTSAAGPSGPNSSIYELSLAEPCRLIPLTEEMQAKINEKYPTYLPSVIPAGWIDGMTEPIQTVETGSCIVIDPSIPEDVVYDITKAVFEHLDELVQIGATFKAVTKETAANNAPCTIHPGALRYYEENGFSISLIP